MVQFNNNTPINKLQSSVIIFKSKFFRHRERGMDGEIKRKKEVEEEGRKEVNKRKKRKTIYCKEVVITQQN